MSFEISFITGEALLLRAENPLAIPEISSPSDATFFVDPHGHRYSATFNGSNVIFNDSTKDSIGRWLLGSSATEIRNPAGPLRGFTFTFMDHGPRPQRLHAVWNFQGPVEQAIATWKSAGFSLSPIDRHINHNHPQAIHLRTKGAFATGADSSHAIIPLTQIEGCTIGDIHVGEFNPLTGCGIGFVLHQLERWMWTPRLRQSS